MRGFQAYRFAAKALLSNSGFKSAAVNASLALFQRRPDAEADLFHDRGKHAMTYPAKAFYLYRPHAHSPWTSQGIGVMNIRRYPNCIRPFLISTGKISFAPIFISAAGAACWYSDARYA